jgi:DNA mismatch repair protein MutS
VAKLAGLPEKVVQDATVYLHELEQFNPRATPKTQATQTISLIQENKFEQALNAIHPDELSPKEALDILYQLKKL